MMNDDTSQIHLFCHSTLSQEILKILQNGRSSPAIIIIINNSQPFMDAELAM